jgi:hypothetical protein
MAAIQTPLPAAYYDAVEVEAALEASRALGVRDMRDAVDIEIAKTYRPTRVTIGEAINHAFSRLLSSAPEQNEATR